jgi:hypothetical protein
VELKAADIAAANSGGDEMPTEAVGGEKVLALVWHEME